MKAANETRAFRSPGSASPRSLTLALAAAALATACSGEYPLGSASASLDLAEEGPSDAVDASADGRVPPVLPQHAFTIAVDELAGPGSLAPVGDLDGDGYGDTAQSSWDFATGASWVHIRYGGPRPRDAVEALAFDRAGATLALEPPTLGYSYTVSSAGDVDGDGFGDLLLMSHDCVVVEPAGPSGAFLVYGGPERLAGTLPLASVSSHFSAPAYAAEAALDLGTSCSSGGFAVGPGDLDGDGFDDVVITFGPQLSPDQESETLSVSYAAGEGVYIHYGRAERFPAEVPLAAGDAVLRADDSAVSAFALGDVNGDGLAELYLAAIPTSDVEAPGYLLAGRAERWRGSVDLPAVATPLPGLAIESIERVYGPEDVDGDGVHDVLLRDRDAATHLFYGRPGLFAEGFDFATSDAVFPPTERSGFVFPAGDLDGDGDSELLDHFVVSAELPLPSDVALSSGSRERLSGAVAFPLDAVVAASPGGRYTPGRYLTHAIPAGDLDGDGADDLFTLSELRFDVGASSYSTSTPQLHVHYGTPAAPSASPR